MGNDQRCSISLLCCKCGEKNCIEYDSKQNYVSGRDETQHEELLLTKLHQKSQSMQLARKVMMKIIDKKNILESELREKNEEISELNDKILTLTTELLATKKDLEKALREIKMLKDVVHDSARKNEIFEQKKMLFSRTQLELAKSDKLLNQEKRKTQALESMKLNLHGWRTMKYADPHYYEILQKKNYLQKELQKKLDLLQSKDNQLQKKSELLNKTRDMLKHKRLYSEKDPDMEVVDYRKTIQIQKDKIKSLTAQVNMLEALVSDRYKKLK